MLCRCGNAGLCGKEGVEALEDGILEVESFARFGGSGGSFAASKDGARMLYVGPEAAEVFELTPVLFDAMEKLETVEAIDSRDPRREY